jgi:hypothetical protein
MAFSLQREKDGVLGEGVLRHSSRLRGYPSISIRALEKGFGRIHVTALPARTMATPGSASRT